MTGLLNIIFHKKKISPRGSRLLCKARVIQHASTLFTTMCYRLSRHTRTVCIKLIWYYLILYACLPSDLFLSVFPADVLHDIYIMHATCPLCLIFRNVISILIFAEECTLWSSALFNFVLLVMRTSLSFAPESIVLK
jgi:hypothetical protein